jgi:pyruvate/2-oxoacid:ferredoxin oxidoreductase beta subunit
MCGEHFAGEPAGSGLFMWSRGDELRFEEPPLCEGCGQNVTLDALTRWEAEEEEEG